MKEELYIIIDEERRQLDLPSPSNITLKWTSNLFNDISKLTCSYSYTFNLPMTANNRRALSLVDDIRHSNSLIGKVVQAEFFVNGVCLCPNANLYVEEISSSYKCVMTWKVLKAFSELKNNSKSLIDLASLGSITWGGSETYGGNDESTSNMDAVVYPDYDAGVPHEDGTPPPPCVPVYKLIQMINSAYGVKFNIGTLMSKGMGMKPLMYLNNKNYYGKRVYDDYVSNGVIPLVNIQTYSEKFTIRGVYGMGSHTMKKKYLEYTQKWDVAVRGTGSSSHPYYLLHWGVIEGEYTSLTNQDSEQLQATYVEPETIAVGIPVFQRFNGNSYIKPIFCYQHDTGLSLFNLKKGERAEITREQELGVSFRWYTRTYAGVEQIVDSFSQEEGEAWTTWADLIENTSPNTAYSTRGRDAGSNIGIVGFYTQNGFTLKGSCTLHIAKAAVDAGRVDVSTYMWICLAAKKSDSDEPEAVTEKDINEYAGFQSTDIPAYDAATDTYVCHFDFGASYDARKIEISSNDEEEFEGYIFLPYFPDDHKKEVTTTTTDEDGTETETTEEVLDLVDGDLYIEDLAITEIVPNIEVTTLPAPIKITQCLPDMTCFNFMKSVFYMNGAMPRLEKDGETISAMYYKQLRDRVNDGEALDWSRKILSTNGEMADKINFHPSKFAQKNYFEMSVSSREEDEDDEEEMDIFADGYGTVVADDKTLDDETTVFQSAFYPAFIQNLRYPAIKVGNTCKIWEGDKSLAEDAHAIYGLMVYRMLDSEIEDSSFLRPDMTGIDDVHKRMNVFSPFDDENMFEELFGYLQTILNDYKLVKEKFMLTEFDLRDFDESMPVYLDKYNSYFAVSTIQRAATGICTVELVKLPHSTEPDSKIDLSYEVELLITGSVSFDVGSNDTSNVYVKKSKDSDWEVYTGRQIEFGSEDIYAITADSTVAPILRIYATAVGQYRLKYKYGNASEATELVRSEANVYYDGEAWGDDEYKSIQEGDENWHKVEIEIPIRDQYKSILEYRRWTSPIFVSKKELAEYGEDEARYSVSGLSGLTYFKLNLTRTYTSNVCPIMYDYYVNDQYEIWGTSGNILYVPLESGYVSRFAYPYEFSYMSGDSYSLYVYISNTLTYTVNKIIGFDTVSSKKLSVKLRTYYDDVRITESMTLTFTKSEEGEYHILKFIADLVNEDGDVIMKLRKKVYWFVSSVDKSIITDDFGDEHDDDVTVKVSDVTVSGSNSIYDLIGHTYTLAFTPTYADINVASVEVSTSAEASMLSVSDVSTSGFTLTASSLPESETGVIVYVKVTLEDGTSFTKEHGISMLQPTLVLYKNGTIGSDAEYFEFAAKDGAGSMKLFPYIIPDFKTATPKSIVSTNSSISTEISGSLFVLSVDGITSDTSADITVVVEYNGVQLTRTVSVKAVYSSSWSTDVLDEAGVLIVDRNGKFYTESEWKAAEIEGDDADGVAVSDGTHRFIIAKTEEDYGVSFGGYGTLVSGQIVADDETAAYADYAGKANSDAVVSALSSSIVHTLRGKSLFPSGQQPYLGAAGEWKLLQSKLSTVAKYLSLIGATTLDTYSAYNDYLTSTQKNANYVWKFTFGTDNKVVTAGKSDTGSHARAFAEIKQVEEQLERGYMSIIGDESFTAQNGTGSATFGIEYGPTGVTVDEVSATSSNEDVKLTLVSNTQFTLSVENILVDEVTTVTVKARLNNLMTTITKQITAVGETVVDYDKLDAAHALIIDKEYNLYTEEEYYAASGCEVEGIAVSDGTHRFIISKWDANDGNTCHFGGRGVTITGLPGTVSSYEYDGEGDTDKIIAAVTASDGYFTEEPYSAAGVARNYIFPTGEKGHLGSNGEWKVADTYYDEINALLAAIGGDSLTKSSSFTYWIATGCGDNLRAWMYHSYTSSTDGTVKHSLTDYGYRTYSAIVRPFRNF